MSHTRKLTHNASITVRVSQDVKRRAEEAAQRQGMSLSEAIRAFLRELARESKNGE